VNHGHRAQVEQVARGLIEAPDAALAQDDLPVPFGQKVLRREQQLLNRRGEPALEQDRLAAPAGVLEEGLILHVPRADLDDVRDFDDLVEALGVHRLGDDQQPGFLACPREQLEAGPAEALERVR
jgi:hypothetical protein